MNSKPKALILTDGKAGHENQSKAFARHLGCEYDVVEVHFKSKLAKTLSYLFDRLKLRTLSLFNGIPKVKAGDYQVVLGTGSGTFYAAKALSRKLTAKCGVVLYPRGYDIGSFDCILAPEFDEPKVSANVIRLPANLVAADESFYATGVAAFREHYQKTVGETLPEQIDSAVGVIIGGPNKCSTMEADWVTRQLEAIFAKNPSSQFWVTTSRRTPLEVEKVIDAFKWNYRLLYSKDHFNPIPAFVKLAKKLYVTAESTGMLSEVCTFGEADVEILDNLKAGPHKFRRFTENLRRDGYVGGNRKIDISKEIKTARKLLGMS